MAEIIRQTDEWSGKKGSHYIEFKINGNVLQIIADDDHVNVIGAPFEDVCTRACNSFYAMLHGGRFDTVQQWHDFREIGTVPVKDEKHA